MISEREIRELNAEWLLPHDVIEKDYVLGWLLAGIAAHPELAGWVFKGGTCLRKCFFETYRFSEDLDFTIARGTDEPDELGRIFSEIGDWTREQCGLELIVEDGTFRRRQNRRGNATTQGRIAFLGPIGRRTPTPPKVRLDPTTDELLASAAVARPVFHPYSDALQQDGEVGIVGHIACYELAELLAEKLRALAERCRPRDLYDVVHVHRHPGLVGRADDVREILKRKCDYVGIEVPTLESVRTSPVSAEVEQDWRQMLEHQLPSLPAVAQFWSSLDDVFAWIDGHLALPTLARAQLTTQPTDETWRAPPVMVSWREGSPLELIRFAGANRLKVDIDYRAEQGRWGPRVVEPYSLRRTKGGRLVLFVVNDRGLLRCYGVDRIARVRVTREPFLPRYVVEF